MTTTSTRPHEAIEGEHGERSIEDEIRRLRWRVEGIAVLADIGDGGVYGYGADGSDEAIFDHLLATLLGIRAMVRVVIEKVESRQSFGWPQRCCSTCPTMVTSLDDKLRHNREVHDRHHSGQTCEDCGGQANLVTCAPNPEPGLRLCSDCWDRRFGEGAA